MPGNKRQRDLARAKYERQAARREVVTARRKRNQRILAIVVVVALVGGSIAWVVLSNRSSGDAAASDAVTASDIASAAASAAAEAESASAAASTEAAPLDCASIGTARKDDLSFASPDAGPPATTMTLQTNCGDIVIAMDAAAPKTVASAAFLARKGFFDNTLCHRLTTDGIFVLQCGDPKQDGTGGPGYQLPDENLPAAGTANYPAGTVAMANAGPGTGGSQFFIVYKDTSLPGNYTIWGHVTKGLDIVKEVASAGVTDHSNDGLPSQPVFIETATVR